MATGEGWLVRPEDLQALERGVALLGSGGGGDTAMATLLLRARLREASSIRMVDHAELPPKAQVMPVGVVGATAVFEEKLPNGREIHQAMLAMERWCGARAEAVISVEVGGLNGLMPLVAAADLDLPCCDADLSGRGIPRLDQFSVAAVGLGLAPAVLAEPSGQVVLLASGCPSDIERTARAFVANAGGWAALALAPITAADLAGCAVIGSVSAALSLGHRVLAAGPHPTRSELEVATGGRVLAEGKVLEVRRRIGGDHGRGGFGRGSVTVDDRNAEGVWRLEMENEYLVALHDGEVTATVPDIVAVLEHRSCRPVLCEQIEEGVEVWLLQLPIAPFWRSADVLPALSPGAYDIPCEPRLLGG